MIEINSAKLILELVDKETGEVITREATLGDFKEVTKKASTPKSKKPKDTDPVAKIEVLDGKVQMNAACVELTQFEPEQKIAIEFEKKGRKITPIMFEHQGKGNRLTKTYTISCRGAKHDELVNYGTVFEVVPYEGKEGYFKLKGDTPEEEDDIIDVPEEIENPEDDDEINAEDFNFNFD